MLRKYQLGVWSLALLASWDSSLRAQDSNPILLGPSGGNAIAVRVEDPSRDRLARVTIPGAVYDSTHDDLSDVTVVDSQSTSVPFVLERQTVSSVENRSREIELSIDSVKELETGELQLLVSRNSNDAGPWPDMTGIKFETLLRDFERSVRVEMQDENREWREIVTSERIFDYSRFADVRSLSIPVPNNRSPQLRITIAAAFDEAQGAWEEWVRISGGGDDDVVEMKRLLVEKRPFRIERIWCIETAPSSIPAVEVRREVARMEQKIVVDESLKTTELEFKTQREPINQLTIETTTRQLRREIEIFVSDEADEEGTRLAGRTIQRLTFDDSTSDELVVSVPETRARYWRIVIKDKGQASLAGLDVIAEGPIDEVLFLAEQGGTDYELRFANNSFTKNSDAHVLMNQYLKQIPANEIENKTVQGILGALRQLPIEPPTVAESWFTKNLLIAEIMLMLVVIGAGIYMAIRRMDRITQETERQGK